MSSILRERKYPLRVPGKDAKAVDRLRKSSGLSFNRIVVLCIQRGLPTVRDSLTGRDRRLTNVEPISRKELERLYDRREEDEQSIRSFIKAQPLGDE
jgi:hypothetical protein